MVGRLTAAFRQFRRSRSGSLSRALRIQRPRRIRGFHPAAPHSRRGRQGLAGNSLMSPTVTDDLELLHSGGRGGSSIPAGGGDDGRNGGGPFKVPERAYF